MYDEVFGEVKLEFFYVAKKEIMFFGNLQEIAVQIDTEEGEEIKQIQRDAYKALMQNWDLMQQKIASSILKYYNSEAKGAYGPDDPEEFERWWPDIDSEEELVKRIHLDTIIIRADFIMEISGENLIYVLFNRDWGGEDLEDDGVAVSIEDGEVSEVGYKYIAF